MATCSLCHPYRIHILLCRDTIGYGWLKGTYPNGLDNRVPIPDVIFRQSLYNLAEKRSLGVNMFRMCTEIQVCYIVDAVIVLSKKRFLKI